MRDLAGVKESRMHDLKGQSDLRLDNLPSTFVLPTHLSGNELQLIEEALISKGATLTYKISEASLIIGLVETLRRAKFELNTRDVESEVFDSSGAAGNFAMAGGHHILGKRKRTETSQSATEDPAHTDCLFDLPTGLACFLRLEWLYESFSLGRPVDIEPYVVCFAKISQPGWPGPKSPRRVVARVSSSVLGTHPDRTPENQKPQGRHFKKQSQAATKPRQSLVRETTQEHDLSIHREIPQAPLWVQEGRVYACERSTPLETPNDEFLDLLEKIRLCRILIEDQIGVRAYSTSIASIAAYPYKLSDPREISRLPGCDEKIETLFREYQSTGSITTSMAVEEDPALVVIRDFYNIWGVGAKTAREWYNERGWREYDDIVQYGWNDLSRVQQIGLKFREEFELKIPRAEVESIASVVLDHAQALTDDRLTCTIVGGYRRGKIESGDVDVILSHPDDERTSFFIEELIFALEQSHWITHTLTLSEANSQRDQEPLGLRMDSSKGGFDTLDKALLVWQDPNWPEKEAARLKDPKAKNPNVHRRVDIIVSPWRTIGCAIAGWSSGTTFQRDLRRYAKHKHGWKFDSSGVRDRKTGRWVDLEGWSDPATRVKTPLEAERRVFEGLGLLYREPWERCTR